MQKMQNLQRVCSISLAAIITLASTAMAATLTVQTVTNKTNYAPSAVVTVRTTVKNGTTRLSSSSIRYANVTIKNASGQTMVNGVAMSKDASTGLCFYSYTLPSSAAKGNWTASVAVTDTSSNTGTGATTFKVQTAVPNHATLISTYEGTKTCLACHSTQANDMFSSVHYQWNGDPAKAIELKAAGSTASKMGGINNFCIQPDKNWLTVFNKTDGTKGPGGCAVCHAGLGLKPSATVSQAQLENIDCLICHAATYSRKVVQNADLTFSLVPADGVDVLAAAQGVTRPTRAACMRCHQNSGGGNNYKRGDIESTNISCTKDYDVHMGNDGQAFACQECHRTEKHRMIGRGVDMRALDAAAPLSCENCHAQLPHRSTNASYTDLNRHTDKVNCTVCHIPAFAKTIPTDMHRNWAVMELDTAKALYDPEMVKATNVTPTYAWFNGNTHFYRFLDPVALDSRGVQKIAWPDGGFEDTATSKSKLYAMKLHVGSQPKENSTNLLLPLKNKIAFETGDVNTAIATGANASNYNLTYTGHTFQTTEQYMGIYHGVGPKATAVSCVNGGCHPQINPAATRIPFSQLGYQRRGTTAQLCDVCHSAKTYSSFASLHSNHRDRKNCSACHGTGYPLKEPVSTLCDNCHSRETFTSANSVHSRHVQGKGYDCSNCHTFSAGMTSGGHSEDH